jgi:hypothetical protein
MTTLWTLMAVQLIVQPLLTATLSLLSPDYILSARRVASRLARQRYLLLWTAGVALVEECLFHWLLPMLVPAVICAALFGLCHAISRLHALHAFIFSMLQIAIVEHSLAAAWLIHIGLNLFIYKCENSARISRVFWDASCRLQALLGRYRW